MRKFDLIAFDADDTLWYTEKTYREIQHSFERIMAPYQVSSDIEQAIEQIEIPNLRFYGYGLQGYILSLIETAIIISAGKITGADILNLISLGKNALDAEIQLLEHVEPTLNELSARYPLMLITKGELLHQEKKISRSGLRDFFSRIEIVSEKTVETYRTILTKNRIEASRFLMVGDSLRSDIQPVIETGGYAVHIPSHFVWKHENSTIVDETHSRFHRLEHIGMLPSLLEVLE